MNTPLTATDRDLLRRALELAEGGRGRVSPNPLVGAVVVRDGQVIGEGFHAELGGLHALIHAAAVLRRRDSIDEVTEDDWDAQVDTNLKATFFLNRAVAQAFIADGTPGRIVNFTSQGWQSGGYGGSVVYSATKGGVVSMSRGLARSLAPHGITVNTIAPAAADTPMLRDGQTDEQLADFIKMIPLGRMAEPREVATGAVFLISDHAAYITGATLNVSGGQLMY